MPGDDSRSDLPNARLIRVARFNSPSVRLEIDGRTIEANAGESVLAALLRASREIGKAEVGARGRAGFCMMGACQDCWVWLANGGRIRACTTAVAEGMQIVTGNPAEFPRNA
ncbi:MAG: (2Fe-2S)-binding protein [Acidobacteriota bacterium]